MSTVMTGTQPTTMTAEANCGAISSPSLPSPRVVTAVEHIRRMRGGSQAHLMRCSDGHFYVVKFKNNPQSPRVLVNEYIAGRLAILLKLPCPNFCLVEVSEDLIRLTPDLSVEEPRSRRPVAAGLAFGSRHPSWQRGKRRIVLPVLDLRLALGLGQVENMSYMLGILVFDKWTSNTDNRQILCLEQPTLPKRTFHLFMIDNGFCFGAHEWKFTDCPFHGLYFDRAIYLKVADSQSLRVWLEQLEANVTREGLDRIVEELPEPWTKDDRDDLLKMFKCLYERKKTVASMVRVTLNEIKRRAPNELERAAAAD